jgi:RsiW-degrading membrane proteinase PrsW (M82 family)
VPLLRFARVRILYAGEGWLAMTRTNALYLVIGALAIAVVVLSYQLYQDRHQAQGVHIDFGPNGLSIHGK